MAEAVIVSAVRTAIGNYGGALQDTPVTSLGAVTIKEALKRAGLRPKVDAETLSVAPRALGDSGLIELEKKYYDWDDSLKEVMVDEVIMGNVVQAGLGQNPARQAAIYAGIPKEVPVYTVNKVCGSGMKAVALAAQAIKAGDAELFIAGGMENMSAVPYYFPKARWGARMFNTELVDGMVHDGLWEIFYGYHMGNTSENIAEKYQISRREQDEFALFKTDGTVTAGNASGITDGAAALAIMSSGKARELGLEPMALIRAYASAGVDPAFMGLGVVPAVKKALKEAGLSLNDIGVIELNEAFASQSLGVVRELGLDLEKVNPLGGGIALGHPIGCSGARILVTLVHQMICQNQKFGLATLCIGGGQGIAMVLER